MPLLGRWLAPWLVALAFTAPLARAGGVRILDPQGERNFHTIQQAVDAAADGDVLLVGPGTYPPFTIDGKGLSILAANAGVQVQGTVTIRNLPAAKHVLVVGISATGAQAALPVSCATPPTAGTGLELRDNAGDVRFQSCTFLGGNGVPVGNGCSTLSGSGGFGAEVRSSARVTFVACVLSGGAGAGHPCCIAYTARGGSGGHGITSRESALLLYGTTARGGAGADAGAYGGNGGSGCLIFDFGLLAVRSSFIGGKGGDAWDFVGLDGGNGGHGLHALAPSQAHLLDNSYAGGAAGLSYGAGSHGATGQGLLTQGAVTHHPGEARHLAIQQAVNRDGTLHTLTATGEPGDRLFVLQSLHPGFRALTPLQPAALFLGKPFPIPLSPTLTLPSSVPVDFAFPTGDLHGTSLARLVYMQGRTSLAGGSSLLGNPLHALVISRQHPPDCDGNGSNDYVDTVLGNVSDIDKNLVPDVCDPDCNGNGVIDGYEVLTGSVPDCDDNGVPDSCDIAGGAARDCNGNSVPDTCDLLSGTSLDQNGNGIPDECEPTNTIVWVDTAAPPGGNGTMGAPYQTLREGIENSFDGNTVLVRDGLYTGPDNRDVDFGGRSIILRSENGAASCVIDCEGLGRAFVLNSGETSATRIHGFTVRNGRAVGSPNGGALYSYFSFPTISNCVFETCRTDAGNGGAIFIYNRARIESCTFVGNSAPNGGGGGVWLGGNHPGDGPAMVDCLFLQNSAQFGGGAHLSSHSHAIGVSRCRFLDNSATLDGGGLNNSAFSSTAGFVSNSLFAGNRAGRDGGGMSLLGVPPLLEGCTMTANSAGMRGGALAFCGPPTSLRNCVLWGNAAPSGMQLAFGTRGFTCTTSVLDVAWCDVQGGQAGVSVPVGTLLWGPGNIDLDPLFADPDGPDGDPLTFLDNDYRLAAGSPCIDAGDNTSVPPDVLDLDGDGDTGEPTPIDLAGGARFVDDPGVPDTGNGAAPIVDLGAFERP